VTSSKWTRRVATSITTSTYRRRSRIVSTWKKSIANKPSGRPSAFESAVQPSDGVLDAIGGLFGPGASDAVDAGATDVTETATTNQTRARHRHRPNPPRTTRPRPPRPPTTNP
jgi:hypothetical protein